jgi:hypothetical protein
MNIDLLSGGALKHVLECEFTVHAHRYAVKDRPKIFA